MALQHLRAGAVTLVLIGGLPGTGKSALAGTLAGPVTGSADPVRRALNAIRPHEPVHLWRPSRPYMVPG